MNKCIICKEMRKRGFNKKIIENYHNGRICLEDFNKREQEIILEILEFNPKE